jgi:DNA ligase-associated metallophosphoesterase
MNLVVSGIDLQLMQERALFLPEGKILVVADLHFGKINHFRMSGLPVPPAANRKNAETLIDLIIKTSPSRMIFLGDLFHSHYNEEWEVVGQIIANFPSCSFELVRGNHDIMSEQQYKRKGIRVIDQERVGPFLLTHEPMELSEIPKGIRNIAGHLHPGARLHGKGRQSVMLPCFWLMAKQIILPAFGSFTGLAAISPVEGDKVYGIVEDTMVELTLEASPVRKTKP